MLQPSSATALPTADAVTILPWPQMARLLAAAAVVGAIIGSGG